MTLCDKDCQLFVKLMAFSGFFSFLHKKNQLLTTWYNWNIVEGGDKYRNPNINLLIINVFIFLILSSIFMITTKYHCDNPYIS